MSSSLDPPYRTKVGRGYDRSRIKKATGLRPQQEGAPSARRGERRRRELGGSWDPGSSLRSFGEGGLFLARSPRGGQGGGRASLHAGCPMPDAQCFSFASSISPVFF